MSPSRRQAPIEVAGLASRRVAADILDGVLHKHRSLDDQLDTGAAHPGFGVLSDRDRALTRKLVATVLRRLGTLRKVLGAVLDRGFPDDAPRVESILLIGVTQILWLQVPDHAAVDLAVRLAQADRRAARYAGLVNATLRRIAQEGQTLAADLDAGALDTPDWLMTRWISAYGAQTARAIATMHAQEPALDLTVKTDAHHWATHLHGEVIAEHTVRTIVSGMISHLPGFSEGAWWVQDVAATLPARLFGDVRERIVVDLCAAPGGKTMQLAHGGAHVIAVDRSPNRLKRLRDNLTRLSLDAEIVCADVAEWDAGPFDAVLLDAPCSSTGTIRRHPDLPWLKQSADIPTLAALQSRLLDHAIRLTKPGGTIIYCTCSLEPEESEQQIAALLDRSKEIRRRPIDAVEVGGVAEWINAAGDLRTLPCHLPHADPRMAGLDGFFAARLERI